MIARAEERRRATGEPTIFFLDEIHRFNKAQQDALLPAVEEGLVTLIGATTENPYFEVNSALSEPHPALRAPSARPTEQRARPCSIGRSPTRSEGSRIRRRSSEEALELLAARSGGDARIALSALERAVETARASGARDRPRGRRGRAAAQGAHLRPRRRPPLRLRLGLDQVDAGLRPGRRPSTTWP